MTTCEIILEDIKKNLEVILSKRSDFRKKEDGSYVSKGDLLIQSIVINKLKEILPNYYLISEEKEKEFFKKKWDKLGSFVILDPIDGTENFVSGLKEWGVGISIYQSGQHIESCIFLPELNEYLITGMKIKKLKYPIVVKPNNEGSSIGVKICKNLNSLKKNVEILLKTYDTLIVENFIGGQEIQVAVLNGRALGAIELKPKRKFYDYKAKYFRSAKTNHIMPANISKKKYNEVLKIAEKTHKILRCRGVTRSDFKFIKNKFYLLEINTQPGMTNLSLVPEIASYKKISFDKLVKKLISDASLNK